MDKKDVIHGVWWSAVEKVGQTAVQLFISIIVARLLSPSDYGIIGILTIFILISNTFVDSGFSQGLIRKLDCNQRDYSTVFWFNGLIGVCVYIILFAISPLLSTLFSISDLHVYSRVLFLVIPISSINIVQTTKLNKELNIKVIASYTVLASTLSGLIGIVMAYCQYGVWALVFQQISYVSFYSAFLWRKSGWVPSFQFDFQVIKDLLGFSSKILITNVLNVTFNNVYTFVIAKIYSSVQLGFYSQANKLATFPVSLLDGILQRVSYPVLASLQNDKKRFSIRYRQIQIFVVILITPMLLLMYLIADPVIIWILSEKWKPVIPYFRVICLSGFTLCLHPLCMSVLKSFGKSDVILNLEIVKKIAIILVVFFTYESGVISLLYGQFIFFVFALLLNMYFSSKYSSYFFYKQLFDIILIISIGLIVYILSIFLASFFNSDFIQVIVKILSFSVIYTLIILGTNIYNIRNLFLDFIRR